MSLRITRDPSGPLRHTLHINGLAIPVDGTPAEGGEATGPSPHDLYDAALGACKALTVMWYANKRQMPVQDVAVAVTRDDSDERAGTYRLRVDLTLAGPLDEGQRAELLRVAEKCPVHKLMTQVQTVVETRLLPAG